MPPHHGHKLVIETALKQSQHVTLVVSILPSDTIPAEQRAAWLRQLYPTTAIAIMLVSWDITDGRAWAIGVHHAVRKTIDAVFSSEDYGHQLADFLECAHIQVDRDRTIVPISASEIRKHPEAYKHFLDPMVWEYFC